MDNGKEYRFEWNALIPFYEEFIERLPGPYYLSPLFLILPLLLAYFTVSWSLGENIFDDLSWLLSVMIGFILVLVIRATKKLRIFLLENYRVFNIDPDDDTLFKIVKKALNYKTMLYYGVFFGLANTAMGLFYGVWYQNHILVFLLLVQFFLVGGVSGFAISGIYGVLRTIRCAMRIGDYRLDCTAADNCGGLTRIGGMLLEFALVSLLAGLVIAFYIYNSPWSHTDWLFVKYVIFFWMGFPHLAAILVVSIPIMPLHTIIITGKHDHLATLSIKRKDLREKLLNISSTSKLGADINYDLLNTKYQILSEMTNEVQNVREWPFNVNSGFSFSVTFLLTLAVPLIELWNSISNLINK